MNYYEENIKCLKTNKKDLYEAFQIYKDSINNVFSKEEKTIEIDSIDTKDNVQSLILIKDNKKYNMNSVIHPLLEVEHWIKQYDFCNLNSVICLFGLGNGLIAKAIAEKMQDSSYLIIYEPSVEVFIYALHNYDLEYLFSHEKVEIAIEDINKLSYHFAIKKRINKTNIKINKVCIHPCYDKVFPENAIFFLKELKDIEFFTKVHINTEIIFGEISIQNILSNLIYLKNSNTINELSQVLPVDCPVVIVAAGPSVADNIEAIKNAKNRLIIIAVDRVVDFLLDNNIEPDFIATVDSIKPKSQFTKRENISIPMICILESQPEIMEAQRGRKIITRVNPFMRELYIMNGKDVPSAATGNSVTTMVFCACINMGFKSIVLVGQDLSYRGDFTHVGGVIEKELINMEVEGINGEKVASREDWYSIINWYKDIIKSNNEITVYDAKDSGAKIEGAIVKPLNKIVEEYKLNRINCKKIIENLQCTFNTEQLMKIKKYFEIYIESLDKIKENALDARHICDIYLSRCEEKEMVSAVSDMYLDELNDITESICGYDIYFLLENYITTNAMEQVTEIYKLTGNQEEDEINTYRKADHVFKIVADGCDYLRPLLEKGALNIL